MPSNTATPPDLIDQIIGATLRAAWRWRTELTLVVITAGVAGALFVSAGPIRAAISLVLLVVMVAAVGPLHRGLAAILYTAQWRRRVLIAVATVGGAAFTGRMPNVIAVKRVGAGARVSLRLEGGTHSGHLDDASAGLATALSVGEVRVDRDRANAALVTLTVVQRDPLSGPAEPWPWRERAATDAWGEVPIGIDEDGETVTMMLAGRHVLVGGEPGAGKSGALAELMTAAALDPTVRLWLLDPKLVELGAWSGCAHRFVGPDIGSAIEVLGELRVEMDQRFEWLWAQGKRKVEQGDGLGLHVVALDELALYSAYPDRKLADAFNIALRDIVARGRAAGIVVLAATQKPSTEILPSSLRDLFGVRWAMRCTTKAASDTILGGGWATERVAASSIDAAGRGVGFLLYDTGGPRRLRTYWLDDQTIDTLARRAQATRAIHSGSGV
jgi:hypothetical protein